MSKHTQEKWEVTGEKNDFVYALGPNGCNKFWFCISTSGPDKISQEEVQANARLIAAAPDLLKALIDLADGYSMGGAKRAREAIAKATGETK